MFPIKTILIFCVVAILGTSGVIIGQNRAVVQVEVADDDKKSVGSSMFLSAASIKVNPLLFFRGDVPIYFETNLSTKFSIEIGVGLTVRDLLSTTELVAGFEDVEDNIASDISHDLGFSTRVGIRFYASNYGFQSEGVYFALEHRLQTYNSVLFSVDDDLALTPGSSGQTFSNLNKKLTRVNNDFKLTLGYVEYFSDNVYIEGYAGFGIRKYKADRFQVESNPSVLTYYIEEDKIPLLALGAKIGILLTN